MTSVLGPIYSHRSLQDGKHVAIVKMHYNSTSTGECVAETVRKLLAICGRENAPNESSIRRLISKFEVTGSQLHTMRSRAGHSLENVDGVEARRWKALWYWTTQEHRFVDVVTHC